MEFVSDFWTIFGTVGTVLFGILGIYLAIRSRYPGKISFIELKSISLFNNIAKNFEEISILHKNQPIKENIIYLQGAFANVGKIDIDKSSIEKGISIQLPDNFEWIKAKVTRSSKDLECSAIMGDTKILKFDLGLFRRNEYFEFEALIEAHAGAYIYSDLVKEFKIYHRISNTQKIYRTDLNLKRRLKRRNILGFPISSLSVLFFILSLSYLSYMFFFVRYPEVEFLVDSGKSTQVEYSFMGSKDSIVVLRDVKGDKEIAISLTEFQEKTKYIPAIRTESAWDATGKYQLKVVTIFIFLFVLFVVLGLIVSLFHNVHKDYESRKVYRILEKTI